MHFIRLVLDYCFHLLLHANYQVNFFLVLSRSEVIVDSEVSLTVAVRPTSTSDVSLIAPVHSLSKLNLPRNS